jgi:hypothetical protein
VYAAAAMSAASAPVARLARVRLRVVMASLLEGGSFSEKEHQRPREAKVKTSLRGV